MAEEDVTGGMAQEGDALDGESAEWVAPEFVEPKGPKRRPGPNDELLASELEHVSPEGIVYVNEDGTPEEEPGAEEIPPEPSYLLVRNKFGPGAHGVYLPDGTPIGHWIQGMTPGEVHERLTAMEMPEDIIDFYVRNRAKAIRATEQMAAHPGQAAFAAHEEEREKTLGPIREAFIKAQGKKG